MARSYDSRKPLDPTVKKAMRGSARTGPIGTITPGDHVEVARDIQRIWLALSLLRRKFLGGSSSVAGITEVTSDDLSVTVTNPTGPVVDLSVDVPASDGIKYGEDNEGNWLDIGTAQAGLGPGGFGTRFHESTIGPTLAELIALGVIASSDEDANFNTYGLYVGTTNGRVSVSGIAGAVWGNAIQSGGGLALGVYGQGSVGAGLAIGVLGQAEATDGGEAYGVVAADRLGFRDGVSSIPADIYLRDDGGGAWSLVARIGATEVALVSGTP